MSFRNLIKRFSADPLARRRAWNKYYERRLRKRDLHLYKAHLNWTLSPTLRELHARWGDTPGIPDDRLSFLHGVGRLAKSQHLEGDTAECGVRYGKSSFFILSAMADPAREHHIFDSFAGLSKLRGEDRPDKGVKPWERGDISVDESTVRSNLAAFANCRYYPGWIPDRFADVSDRSFALVHIDVDLYQPTADSLAFFYDRMVVGGLIVCDDYGFASCPGATRAFDEFFADRQEGILPIPTGQCVVWKR